MSDVTIEYGAVENKNKHAGGWLPVTWQDGKQRGDTWSGKGYSQDDAIAMAESIARGQADRYVGDYRVSVRKRAAPEQSRDKSSGQYVHSTFETMCVCGHTLGEHTAASVGGKRPCVSGDFTGINCPCEKFRKKRAKASKAA